MPSLRLLDLSHNILGPNLPAWIFGVPVDGGVVFAPHLATLRLRANRLRNLPRHMWLAPCLFCLDISENAISGDLPRLSLEEVALVQKTRALGRTSVFLKQSPSITAEGNNLSTSVEVSGGAESCASRCTRDTF